MSSGLSSISTQINNLRTAILNGNNSISTSINSLANDLGTYFSSLNSVLTSINSNISGFRTDNHNDLVLIHDKIDDFMTLVDFWNITFFDFLTNFQSAIGSFLDIDFTIDWDNILQGSFGNFSYKLSSTLHNLLLDVHDEITNQVNPLSKDNKPSFDATIETLKSETFIGNAYDFIDTGNIIVNSISSASPNAHLYVNTLPANFVGISIPSKTIDIDLSWYGAYRQEAFVILRAFMIIGWCLMIFRRIPAILSGAPMDIINHFESPDSSISERITVDDNGEVLNHETITRDGNVTTIQKHKR